MSEIEQSERGMNNDRKRMYICTDHSGVCNRRCNVIIEHIDNEPFRIYECYPCMKTSWLQRRDTPYFKLFVMCEDLDGEPFVF